MEVTERRVLELEMSREEEEEELGPMVVQDLLGREQMVLEVRGALRFKTEIIILIGSLMEIDGVLWIPNLEWNNTKFINKKIFRAFRYGK
jgi:hypothetical protein